MSKTKRKVCKAMVSVATTDVLAGTFLPGCIVTVVTPGEYELITTTKHTWKENQEIKLNANQKVRFLGEGHAQRRIME